MPLSIEPTAGAAVTDFPTPSAGCVDSVAAGFGTFNGEKTPAGGAVVEVPGPVLQAIVEWTGRDDQANGVSQLDLEVTGPGGVSGDAARVGTITGSDTTRRDGTGGVFYAWYADITDLFAGGDGGSYTVDVEPFATAGRGVAWGGVVTVIYDTTPCPSPNELFWKVGADYYFGGDDASDATTDVIAYDWGRPLEADTTVTVRVSHGGADSTAAACRVSALWMASGSGVPPTAADDLVSEDGVPVFPGASEAVVDPFTPSNQPCPPPRLAAPATAVRGGNVGPEFALIEVDVVVPAGAEWLALQLESPRDNDGFPGAPESGSWGSGAVLTLPATAVEPAPAIALEKTVLAGADAACPGTEGADEAVEVELGSRVTYCFRVLNTGDTPLYPVTIQDDTLGIDSSDMTLVAGDDSVPLLPGDELVYSYAADASGDLVNVAVAGGVPSDDEGEPLGLEPVTATNDASVATFEQQAPAAAIALEKTVLAGHGAACPGLEGTDERVTDVAGAPVTYCFRVTNTGEAALSPVTLDDDGLGIDQDDMSLVSGSLPLGPGAELVYAFPTAIAGDLVSAATATGIPAEPGLDPVSDTNDAGVLEIGPAIDLVKTVALGHGVTCPGGENAAGELGTPITFCFAVTNVGDTPLFPIVIDDPVLGITTGDLTLLVGDDAVPLVPGASLVYTYETTIQAAMVNIADATGVASDEAGTPVDPPTSVTDTDDATVEVVAGQGGEDPGSSGGDPGDGSEGLPVTGAETGRHLAYAVVLLMLGATMVLAVTESERRRSRR